MRDDQNVVRDYVIARGPRVRHSLVRTGGNALIILILSKILHLHACYAATPSRILINVPMTADSWSAAPLTSWVGKAAPSLKFARYEGMPLGTMTVNDAVAVSKTAHFSSGTLEFDIKPLEYNDTGIIFRRQGNLSGEFVYARANPDCPAADDCIQYAPIDHARMGWDIYADFQGPAPIAPTGWNHFRLVVARDKMLVYVNRQSEPSLVVPRLQGLSKDGGIAFKGPAVYANLVIRPDADITLPDVHVPPPEPGTITSWLTAAPSVFTVGKAVLATDIPPADGWRRLQAEASGLVNFGRAYGSPSAPSPSVGWLKLSLDAASPVHRTLRLGWKRVVTVFLNGQPIYTGENPYYPDGHRLSPNGRLEADNASVPLVLRQGRNEIVLAVADPWTTSEGIEKLNPYGWAAEAHIDDMDGLAFEP